MDETQYAMVVDTTHRDGVAKTGEKIFFHAILRGARSTSKVYDGVIRWKLARNGDILSTGEFPAASHAAGVTLVPDRPGYYRCDFEAVVGGRSAARGALGVLVDPDAIRSGGELPADFDDFWMEQRKKLCDVPLNLRMKHIETVCGLVTCDITADCLGIVPVRGLSMHPAESAPRSLPAVLTLQGAGVRTSGNDYQAGLAQRGFLTLDINAHGIENDLSPSKYLELAETKLAGYPARGFDIGDPGKVYFLGMFLRVLRAIDILESSPLWDGRNLILWGASQGAWQCLAGAALSDSVSCLCVYIPAGCGIAGGGWPSAKLSGSARKSDLAKTIPYFDGVNFCTRIGGGVPVLFSIGLIDDACRADGVVAAYNNLKSEHKKLAVHCELGHDANHGGYVAEQLDFILKHLR